MYFTGEVSIHGPAQNGKGLLIFSTPHSGKTTLLQGIMNYIFGVSSSDNFRLCFAPEFSNTVCQLNYKTFSKIFQTIPYVFVNLFVQFFLNRQCCRYYIFYINDRVTEIYFSS